MSDCLFYMPLFYATAYPVRSIAVHKSSTRSDGTFRTRCTLAAVISVSPVRLIKFYPRIRALSLGPYTDSSALNMCPAQKSIPSLKIAIQNLYKETFNEDQTTTIFMTDKYSYRITCVFVIFITYYLI